MKVGILTFHSVRNYGAVLQCYALYHTLHKIGYAASVIDFSPDYIIRSYRLYSPLKSLIGALNKLKMAVRLTLVAKSHLRRALEFKRFIRRHTKLCRPTETYDCVIYGSDQIWNPRITDNIEEYWGGGSIISKKKIAYAASVGNVDNLRILTDAQLTEYLKRFDVISVRERNLTRELCKYTDKTIEQTCDPVFLCTKEDWNEICEESETIHPWQTSEKYIFLYNLTAEERVASLANQIKEATGLHVIEFRGKVCIDDGYFPERKSEMSPADFVSFIKNAEFVVTSSFHGLAFALLFGKRFLVYSSYNTDRMHELLKICRLEERFSDTFSPKFLHNVDVEEIENHLSSNREQSVRYLVQALQG